jgi:hypothetical protein
MKSSELVSEAEIADIIFNTEDAELNDLLCYSKGKHDFNRIICNICLRLNASHAHLLIFGLESPDARREFIKEKVKIELIFYATAPLRKIPGASASSNILSIQPKS